MTIAFDGKTGAITTLRDEITGIDWASPTSPLAQLIYTTWDEENFNSSPPNICNWVLGGKPGSDIASPVFADWYAAMSQLYFNRTVTSTGSQCHMAALMAMPPKTVSQYGGAPEIWVELYSNYTSSGRVVDIVWQYFDKTPTRLAESYMLAFEPNPRAGFSWVMDKIGSAVDPMDVVNGGSQQQHAVWSGVKYMNASTVKDKSSFSNFAAVPGMQVFSPDIPCVNPITASAEATPLTPTLQPITGPVTGFAFNMINNVWNTNYIFWYPFDNPDADGRFRFQIRLN